MTKRTATTQWQETQMLWRVSLFKRILNIRRISAQTLNFPISPLELNLNCSFATKTQYLRVSYSSIVIVLKKLLLKCIILYQWEKERDRESERENVNTKLCNNYNGVWSHALKKCSNHVFTHIYHASMPFKNSLNAFTFSRYFHNNAE